MYAIAINRDGIEKYFSRTSLIWDANLENAFQWYDKKQAEIFALSLRIIEIPEVVEV